MCILPHTQKNQIRTFSNIKILYKHKNALKILYETIISRSQKTLFSGVKCVTTMWYPWTDPSFLGIWPNVFRHVLLDCTVAIPKIQLLRQINHIGTHWAHLAKRRNWSSILFSQSSKLGFSLLVSKITQIFKSWDINIVSLIHKARWKHPISFHCTKSY